MKKKIFKGISVLALAATVLLPACSKKELTDLNKPVNAIGFIIPENVFTNVLLNLPKDNYGVMAQGVQYFSTYKEVPGVGDKYYSFNGTTADFGTYTNNLNRLMELDKALTAPDDGNRKALVRILRVYTYHQLTDVAGDIPYFQAVKGEEGVLSPEYDTQESIYKDMFKELKESAESLTAGQPTFGNGDLFYKGDVAKWKKFAYTLMLRLGMRLTKVDPALAETWVKTAIAGGVMTSNDDIAKIQYANTTGNINPKINTYINGNYASPGGDNVEGGKYAATFIDELKSTSDPRLPVMSVVWKQSSTGYVADNTPDVQRGMVSGSLNTRPLDFDTYSEPSPLILNLAAPIVIMGPAEAYLLLAEASLRGWYNGATEEASYNDAVRSAMAQWSLWAPVAPSSNVITPAQVDAYLAANPYKTGGTFQERLEQISVQKWISLFGDDYEVYSNWRRTGYPVLTPVNYPGNVTGGKLFRRFSIPITENLVNRENYLEALQRQGFSEQTGDNLLTRVWWDKQ